MISETDIKSVANLSRLGLTDDELSAATKDVGNILEHFSVIQNIDTAGVPSADEPTGQSGGDRPLKNVTREDVAQPETLATHRDLLANAPHVEKGQIKVPAVFSDSKE